ncbi:MAG: omptin family outer membrane protease [Spirochaetaceae bacterium]|nr:omptin family outer membrane protease [Spirochaetaceae bacterium]
MPVLAKDAVRGEWEVSGGVLFGVAHEYVLKDSTVISRLDWDENGAAFTGLNGKLNLGGLFVQAGLLSAIPPQYPVGNMRDYDFLLADSSKVSHYSSHVAYLDKHFQLNAATGYVFSLRNFEISSSVGYVFTNRKWTAADGFLQYPKAGEEWTGSEAKEKVAGTVIAYEQALHMPFFAVGMAFKSDSHKIELAGSLSPFMWCGTLDSHFIRAAQFYDKMQGGIGGRFEAAYSFYPALRPESGKTQRIGFKAALGYQFIRDLAGTTASQKIGKTNTAMAVNTGYGSKMETDMWQASLGVLWYF